MGMQNLVDVEEVILARPQRLGESRSFDPSCIGVLGRAMRQEERGYWFEVRLEDIEVRARRCAAEIEKRDGRGGVRGGIGMGTGI